MLITVIVILQSSKKTIRGGKCFCLAVVLARSKKSMQMAVRRWVIINKDNLDG
jgi:hypothetical protein